MTRIHLTATDYHYNISLWGALVEQQTGKPFQLTGAILCVGEELGEMEAALYHGDMKDAADAIGDVYVASWTVRRIIREMFPAIEPDDDLEQFPIQERSTIVAQIVGEICEVARKGLKDLGDATEVYDSLRRIAVFARRVGEDRGLDFEKDCIEPVLDILDRRLVEGYHMRNGSAIKRTDQQPTGVLAA